MTARILNGNPIRDQIFAELEDEIGVLAGEGIKPGLAVVLAGGDPASQIYVKSKIAACQKLGLASYAFSPPATVQTGELLAIVEGLNRRDDVDGILVQMPLPPQVDAMCPIGAGDALSAVFTWSMSRGQSPAEALRWGVAAGTASARLPGMSFASLAQTEEIFRHVETRRVE